MRTFERKNNFFFIELPCHTQLCLEIFKWREIRIFIKICISDIFLFVSSNTYCTKKFNSFNDKSVLFIYIVRLSLRNSDHEFQYWPWSIALGNKNRRFLTYYRFCLNMRKKMIKCLMYSAVSKKIPTTFPRSFLRLFHSFFRQKHVW